MTIDEMQERMLNILAGYYRNNHVFHASQKMPSQVSFQKTINI